ncbi:hypothetical protein BH23CHL7_BH23CHL7_07550 [soil metagenome]
MRFQTTIELGGKTATGFQVPRDVVEALGRGKRVPVVVTINGHLYRSTIAPYGGAYYLPLSAENRTAAAVAAGDEIEVDIEVDDKPREISVPDDLAQALDAARARAAFDALSYSGKRGIVEPIEAAKAADTRQRRIEKAVTELS